MGRGGVRLLGGLAASALLLAGCSDEQTSKLEGPATVTPPEPIMYAEFTPSLAQPAGRSIGRYALRMPHWLRRELNAGVFSNIACVPRLPFALASPPPWVGDRAALVQTGIEADTELKSQLQGAGMESMVVIEVTDRTSGQAEADRLNDQLRLEPGFDTTDCPTKYGAALLGDYLVIGSVASVEGAREAADGDSLATNGALHGFPRSGGNVLTGGFAFAPPAIEAAEEVLPGSGAGGLPELLSAGGALRGASGPLGQVVGGPGLDVDKPVFFDLRVDAEGLHLTQDYALERGTPTGPPTKLLDDVPAEAYAVFSYAGFGAGHLKNLADLLVGIGARARDTGEGEVRDAFTEELGFDPSDLAEAVGDLIVYGTEETPDRGPGQQLVAVMEVEDREIVDRALQALRERVSAEPELAVLPVEDSGFSFAIPSVGQRLFVYLGADRLVLAMFGGRKGVSAFDAGSVLNGISNGLDFGPSFAENPVPPALAGTQVTQYVDFSKLQPLADMFAPGAVEPGRVQATFGWARAASVGTQVEDGRSTNTLFIPMPARRP